MSSIDKDKVTPPEGAPKEEKHINPFLEPIFIAVAAVLYLLVKPAKWLKERSYKDNPFVHALDVVATVGAGIGAGYWTGWHWEWTAAWWVLSGVVTSLVTYFYAFPALWAGVLKNLGRASEELWDAVYTADGKGRYGSRHGFLSFVMFLGYVGIVGGAAFLGYTTLNSVFHTFSVEWSWWWIFAGPGSLVVAAIVAFGAGAIAWTALSNMRMWLVAPATGSATVYALHASTAALVESHLAGFGLPALALTSIVYAAYALQFAIYVAYLFPLALVIVIHGFSWVIDVLGDLLESVYGEEGTEYQKFFGHSVNLFTTYQLAILSLLVWPLLGLAVSAKLALVVAGVVGFLAYLVVGRIFTRWEGGNALIGAIASLYIGAKAGLLYFASGYVFGLYGAIVAGLLSAVLTFVVCFPLGYVAVRFVLKLIPIYKLGIVLEKVHATIYGGFDRIFTELAHAYDNTYSDNTKHRVVFLHLVNVVTAAAIGYGMHALSLALGFGAVLTWSSVGVLSALSYVLIGKGLVDAQTRYERKTGNKIVGTLVGLTVGIIAGAFTFYSVAFGFWTACGVALLAGLVSAGVTYSFFFPIAYVLLKGVGYVVREEKWLYPALTWVHGRAWNVCANGWNQVKHYYNLIDQKLQPFLKSIDDTWESAKKRIKESWGRATDGK